MNFSVILTSYKEPETIKRAIEQIIRPNLNIAEKMELIVVAPDDETLNSARTEISKYKDFDNALVLQDSGKGKPSAINEAVQIAKGEILILTDGDMHISDNAISDLLGHFKNPKTGGVSGHPVSLDDRNTQFGYYSHLFCEAAHEQRLNKNFIPMSGYLYAIRNIKKLFPLPEDIRAEDAYLSKKILEEGLEIKYEPKALAHVHFPKNLHDWLKQKKRSLGGNVQAEKARNIGQDLKTVLFPLNFAKSPMEFLYSVALYPLRLYLWLAIYSQHFSGDYSKGQWERIESSKS